MSVGTSARRGALLATLLCLAGSCRGILGIEDAEVDPSLDETMNGQGSAGGNGGDGGLHEGTAAAPSSLGGAPAESGGQPPDADAGSSVGGGPEGEAGAAGQPGTGGTLCERYCDVVMTNCTDAFAVYTSHDACLALCAAMPEGVEGDRDVNTAHCRLRAATLAPDEIPHYCPIAGPGGNDGCGSNCESLCALRDVVCADYLSTDNAGCMADCESLPDLHNFSVDLSANQYEGPHVQCRLYHITAAAVDDAEQHCLHVDGEAPCQ